MADEIEWITPAEAERLVAACQGPGGMFLYRARDAICTWIGQEHIRTMALEVVRWEDAPFDPPATDSPVHTHQSTEGQKRQGYSTDEVQPLLMAYRVNPAYRPGACDFPVAKIETKNVDMTIADWAAAASSGVDQSSLWDGSTMSFPLRGNRSQNARVAYSGIRFAKEDLERRIEIAGWTLPAPIDHAAPSQSAPSKNRGGRRPSGVGAWRDRVQTAMHEKWEAGGWEPSSENDVIRAMQDWISHEHDESPADATLRPIAKILKDSFDRRSS